MIPKKRRMPLMEWYTKEERGKGKGKGKDPFTKKKRTYPNKKKSIEMKKEANNNKTGKVSWLRRK